MTKYDAKALQTKLLQALDEYGDYNIDASKYRERVEAIRRHVECLFGGPSQYLYYAPDDKRFVRLCGPVSDTREASKQYRDLGTYKVRYLESCTSYRRVP